LVTDIPWTPGQRELAFTYVLPNEDRNRVWQRPLDLPCDDLRIEIHTDNPDDVVCNLPRDSSQINGSVRFASSGKTLPAGHLVSLQLERLPISWATYGRWLALVLLVGLVAAASLIGTRRRQNQTSQLGGKQASSESKQAA